MNWAYYFMFCGFPSIEDGDHLFYIRLNILQEGLSLTAIEGREQFFLLQLHEWLVATSWNVEFISRITISELQCFMTCSLIMWEVRKGMSQ